MGGGASAEKRENPLGHGLIASDKTFGSQLRESQLSCLGFLQAGSRLWIETHNAGLEIDGARERVYTHDMGDLIVPWAVLSPVCR